MRRLAKVLKELCYHLSGGINDLINEAHLLMLQSQELAHFGNWRWDVQEDLCKLVARALCDLRARRH